MNISRYIKQLSKDTLVYGFGDAFVKILGILTIPIYTRIFNPSDYGILSLVSAIITFFSSFLDLGMISALQRSYFDSAEEKERKKIISTAFWFLLIWGIFFTFIIILLSKKISLLFFDSVSFTWILVLSFLNAFLSIFIILAKDLSRFKFRPWLFFRLVSLNGILTTIFSLFLIIYFKFGILGFFLGGFLGTILTVIFAWRIIKNFIIFVFSLAKFKKMFSYGIMLVPTVIAYFIFDISDRFFLVRMSTLHELGLYSMAINISGIMMFLSTALAQAWSPFAFKLYAEERNIYKNIYSRMMNYIMIGFSFLSIIIALFSSEILKIITIPEFFGANKAIPFLLISMLFYASTLVTLLGLNITRKTKYIALSAGITALLNIILNIIFIPKLGMVGAALATAISYIVLALMYFFISQKLHPISYNLEKIIKILIITLLIFGINSFLHFSMILNILFKFGLIIIFTSFLFVFNIFESGEILFLKSFLKFKLKR